MNDCGPEAARNRLDGILDTLVKTPVKDGSANRNYDRLPSLDLGDSSENISIDDDSTKSGAFSPLPSDLLTGATDLLSPASTKSDNPLITKEFDRTVDFTEINLDRNDVPLYPVLRSWVRSDTDLPINLDEVKPDIEQDGVLSLPSPSGPPLSKIPPGLKRSPVKDIDLNTPEEDLPRPEILFIQNLQHWKAVRQKWKDFGKARDRRHEKAFKILRDMYNRSSTTNTTLSNIGSTDHLQNSSHGT